MNDVGDRRTEDILGRLFTIGTGLGCLLIACGLVAGSMGSISAEHLGRDLITAGIGTFVLLPTARVAMMIALFLRARDYLFAAVATAVLLTILTGCLAGEIAQRSSETLGRNHR